MKKRTSFIKLIKLLGIIFLTGIGVSVVAIDVVGSHRDFNFRADQMRADYLASQKQIIKQEVHRVVDLISYGKAQSEILTREKIKSRVYEAYSIAQNIYQQNKTTKSEAEIQQMILDVLRSIRFENETGYYFAIRMDGMVMLNANKPELEGKNLLGLQDTHGKKFIEEMIKVAKQSGEGFDEYYWVKPGVEGNNFKKISFIKIFKPYSWIIGAGLYVDDVEEQIKKDLLSTISRIRFGKEGYIFINRLNGDALVSNGKLFSGTKKLWEVFNKNPEKMKDIFDKEYNAALKPEGDYIYYSHIKLTTPNIESPKASFIYGIPDLQWLVGAGVYLDDVETDIALMHTKLNDQIKAKMLYFILIVMGIIALFFLFFNWLNRGLKNDFKHFVSFFNRAAHSDVKIDREAIKFVELDQVAEYANKMLTDRKQAEDSLRESEERLAKINKCFLHFGTDPLENINLLTILCGELLEATCALYNRFDQGMLCSWGQWNTPPDYNPVDKPDGHICFDVIKKTEDRVFVVSNLQNTHYAQTDPNVIPYKLQTYLGRAVKLRDTSVGSLCVVYQDDFAPSEGDKKIMEIIASAIGVEEERKRAEQALRTSEEKLARSKKMESLGLLAGGVAHDLNNVLAGIVSYPELLLLDLPEDSNLRKPIETIKETGHRAAAIVQDLITVARGVAIAKEPMNLNAIVEDYLLSLEFKKLKQFNSTVTIKTNFDTDLLNISGSDAHLRKVVMNLVSNASEAIEGSGNVLISTMNRYVDRPISGYDDVYVGEYAVLSVSDNGPGISPDDLERIFEPFYTKKVMGRSGTGLGLAVVWNVVQDLKGYINVISDENGTTFELYFPITRDEVSDKGLPISIKDYQGSGESILVVDDVESQREIACKMLETLGYKTKVVSSGEEAVEYLKEHTVDLILLDMIMYPGINGRETYERMIEINPNQKAVIASGFAETDDVKKAQKLGAGQYIKKPLTLEKLGIAVRDELKK